MLLDVLYVYDICRRLTVLPDISAALSVSLQQQGGCFFSVQQSFFSCLITSDSQTVVFLAELSYSFRAVDRPSLPPHNLGHRHSLRHSGLHTGAGGPQLACGD